MIVVFLQKVSRASPRGALETTANLHAKILDFGGSDSGIRLSLMAGILMSVGNLAEIPSQQIGIIFVGIILVGRLSRDHLRVIIY